MASEIVSGESGDLDLDLDLGLDCDFDFDFGRGESGERSGVCGCSVDLGPSLGG